MKPFSPSDPWMPGHVIMGNSISEHSVVILQSSLPILEELREAGVLQDSMRVKLVLSAKVATKAIAKMLVSCA